MCELGLGNRTHEDLYKWIAGGSLQDRVDVANAEKQSQHHCKTDSTVYTHACNDSSRDVDRRFRDFLRQVDRCIRANKRSNLKPGQIHGRGILRNLRPGNLHFQESQRSMIDLE